MNKILRVVLVPTVLLILIVGCLVPLYNELKEERCNMALMTLIDSDLLDIKSAGQIFAEHPDILTYLMKHPKSTLKICLQYEAENPENENTALIAVVAAKAYTKATGGMLPENGSSLKEAIQELSPELYEELAAE